MKYSSIILICPSFFIAGCSENNDEPKPNEKRIIGYWAITHTQTIEHINGSHSTHDKDVPPHGMEGAASDEAAKSRYDVLIFNEDMVTVRGDMPSRPHITDYDAETADGQLEFQIALQNWENNIGQNTDQLACPVGKYNIIEGNLFIGSLNMGRLNFSSDNEFTLDYKKTFNNPNDYKTLIYTYTRIYSLTL